jgi:flagellar biogenesis protein FliO
MMTVNLIVAILLIGYLIYIVKKTNREYNEFQDNFIQSLKTLDKKIDSIIINKGDKEHIL